MSEEKRYFRPVIALWSSMGELAGDIGEAYVTVQQWHWRDSIPTAHFPKIVKAARERSLSHEDQGKRKAFAKITLDHLVTLAGQRAKKKTAA